VFTINREDPHKTHDPHVWVAESQRPHVTGYYTELLPLKDKMFLKWNHSSHWPLHIASLLKVRSHDMTYSLRQR
jgi:hypothetical protein